MTKLNNINFSVLAVMMIVKRKSISKDLRNVKQKIQFMEKHDTLRDEFNKLDTLANRKFYFALVDEAAFKILKLATTVKGFN